ncbi:hypothetical protein XENOCAPTIV_025545 [Xenoophorus captivus]|uniref:Uncharacterized protein n=1 Tax=Xenoophorus captivus TaxID=1517983 RepID=A0ABV0S294_9TELE
MYSLMVISRNNKFNGNSSFSDVGERLFIQGSYPNRLGKYFVGDIELINQVFINKVLLTTRIHKSLNQKRFLSKITDALRPCPNTCTSTLTCTCTNYTLHRGA